MSSRSVSLRLAVAVAVALSALAGAAGAQSGFYLESVAPEAEFTLPVAVAAAPDGRLFVAEKLGRVRVVHPDGTVPEEPFVDVWDELDVSGDRGLIGLALAPDFEASGFVYLLYTVDTDDDPWNGGLAFGRVVRYRADPERPDHADPATRHIVLGATVADGIPSCLQYHTVGTLAFGSDGTLLVGSGDSALIDAADDGGLYPDCFGAERTDPATDIGAFRAQALTSPNGKILRLDSETGLGLPSNPFYTGNPDDTASKVWAFGLRNPFRFSVAASGADDPADGRPGRLVVGDVGWYAAEELDLVDGGENFGWPCIEGPYVRDDYVATPRGQTVCAALGATEAPAAWWHRWDPARSEPAGLVAQSITAGVVYPGTTYPAPWRGRLFLGDFSARWLGAATLDGDHVTAIDEVAQDLSVVGFAYDPVADVVVGIDIATSTVFRLRYAGSSGSPPVARASTAETLGVAPFEVELRGDASFDPDGGALVHAWDFGDGATSTEANPRHTYSAPGAYHARLMVTDPAGGTASTVVRIRVGEAFPEIKVASPKPGEAYHAGARVALRASATDPYEEDADLDVRWTVDLVHNMHVHPSVTVFDGPEAEIEFPSHGDGGEVVFYRIRATVADGEGLSRSVVREIRSAPEGDLRVDRSASAARAGGGPAFTFVADRRLTRLELLAPVDPEAVTVEVREGGVWGPARSVHVLDGGGAVAHHVLFEHVAADAVRLGGAPTLAADSVRVYAVPEEDPEGLGLALFPNPVTETLSVAWRARPGTYRLTILSPTGRDVGQAHVLASDAPEAVRLLIDAGDLAAGVYVARLVRLESGEQTVRSFVVLR